MSNTIMCDGCKKVMYADSRSAKGDYHEIWIDRTYSYHLCRSCYDAMMRYSFGRYYDEDEQQYVETEELEATKVWEG